MLLDNSQILNKQEIAQLSEKLMLAEVAKTSSS